MRRLAILSTANRGPAARCLLGTIAVAAALAIAPAPAFGGDDDPGALPRGAVSVVEVSGLLDPVLADFVEDAIDDVNANGDLALVLQLNSRSSVISDDRLLDLAERVSSSPVPVTVWVGPSGSRATGKVAQLASVAAKIGVAPGARLGDTGELLIQPKLWDDENALVMRDRTLNWEQVIDRGVVACERQALDELGRTLDEDQQRLRCAAPTVGDFVVDLDEFGFEARQIDEADEIRLEPITQVRFEGLDLLSQLMHTVASPPIAYLLFAAGAALLVFELYTAGVGVAGVVGAGCFVLACYGLAVLPLNTWALVLLVLAMLAYAVDVQTGVPRLWTAVATVLFTVGTIWLYDGVSMSWIPMTVGIGGMVLAMAGGMPAMVRTRFSTPTIGREWMVGELGEAVDDVQPEGVVKIRDALWRAYTNRATPITGGDRVRVVAIEGLILEVEPEEGGARDYRSRSPRD